MQALGLVMDGIDRCKSQHMWQVTDGRKRGVMVFGGHGAHVAAHGCPNLVRSLQPVYACFG